MSIGGSAPRLVLLGLAISAAWMLSGLAAPMNWQFRYDAVRAVQLATIGALLLALMIRPAPLFMAIRATPAWVVACLVTFTVLGFVSALWAPMHIYALMDVSLLFALVVVALSAFGICIGERRTRLADLALGIASSGALLLAFKLGIDYVATAILGSAAGLSSSWGAFENPRYFAKAATWAIPLLWAFPFLVPRPNRRPWLFVLSSLAAIVIWSHVIGSGSRGAVIAMSASSLIAGLFLGRPGKIYAIGQWAFAGLGALVWFFFVWAYDAPAPWHLAETTVSGRSILFMAALSDLESSPLLGIGPMQFAAVESHPAMPGAGPHNLPLQVAAEWGAPASILFMIVLCYCAWSYFQFIKQTPGEVAEPRAKDIDVALLAAILAALFHSSVANVLNDPISQTIAVLVAGIAASHTVRKAPVPIFSQRWAHVGVIVGGVFLCTILSIAAYKGTYCIGATDEVEYLKGSEGAIVPRFWTQGLIPLEKTCKKAADK